MSAAPPSAPLTKLTNRRVLNIAIPIVLSNATIPLLGLVDTGVVGQLGQAEPIGAVGLGAIILTSIYWIFGFLRMGTTGLIAQSHGQGDEAESGAHLLRALAIACAAGLFFIVFQLPLFWLAFKLAPASDTVEALTRDYLGIRIWGAPATIGLYAITGWLIAIERTRTVLVMQVFQNGLNVVLSILLGLQLGWGVSGVAWATLIAEWAGILLGLWFARDVLRRAVRAAGNMATMFARDKLNRLTSVNGNIMIRSVLVQASFTSFMFLGAAQGDVTLAANQVLMQFLAITAYALDGFAFAAESLVGQAVGAHRPDRVRRASILTSQWGVAGAVILGLVFWIGGGAIIDMLTTAPDVRAEARQYLIWLGFAPLIGIASWMFDGIFIGATLTRDMRIAMIQAVLIYLVAVLTLPPLLGNHGLWASLMILNAARGATMALRYPRAEKAAEPVM